MSKKKKKKKKKTGQFRRPARVGTTNPDDACSINNNSNGVNHKQAGTTPSPDGWWEVREVPTGGIYRKTADPLEANTSARSRWVWVASICDFFFFWFVSCFVLNSKEAPAAEKRTCAASRLPLYLFKCTSDKKRHPVPVKASPDSSLV